MNVQAEGNGEVAGDTAQRPSVERAGDHNRKQGLRVLAGGPGGGGDRIRRRFGIRFRDEGCTVGIIGGGPSAGDIPAECFAAFPCIAVNDAWRLNPAAEAIYAADRAWWERHYDAIRAAGYAGRCFGADLRSCTELGIEHRAVEHRAGLSQEHYTLCAGGPIGNSGAQAINLAYLAGARRIMLFGFDMQGSHWFGDHPRGLARESPYKAFISGMAQMASDLVGAGVSVLNCSTSSALPYFQRLNLQQVVALCAPT